MTKAEVEFLLSARYAPPLRPSSARVMAPWRGATAESRWGGRLTMQGSSPFTLTPALSRREAVREWASCRCRWV